DNLRTFKISGLSLQQSTPYNFSSSLVKNIKNLKPLVSVKKEESFFSFEITLEQLSAGKRSK
ncbi:MAG: hypothetical protein NE327_06100, partial [Lentisphaeraceae bacterium]|nr:hypothetical protein [Lentisphaeraceae bacterium]